MANERERYIGDGVYASLDPARMIMLRTERGTMEAHGMVEKHWIALEPEVLQQLVMFAYEIGWGDIILGAAVERIKASGNTTSLARAIEIMTDADYARAEEDAERIRASKEGFPDE